jgi:asparagine synthase (glutamine-hydrolysing)
MCGIAGYFGPGLFDPNPFLMTLAHRGPDAAGVWSSGEIDGNHVYLVHTRLAILDLTDAGNQPMQLRRATEGGWQTVPGRAGAASGHDRSGYAVAYNGEIYNFADLRKELQALGHCFTSTGDTEVLLRGYAEWGRGIFAKLDGIFAVLIYDGPAGRLVAARDHLGIKPLYYARGLDGGLVFASQVRTIAGSGRWKGGVSRTALLDYLRFGSYQEPATVFSGISAVEPGCVAWLELAESSPGLLRSERYWSMAPVSPLANARDWKSEHSALLRDTVREQLVADVPVGVFLSGGIDSTLLLEIAAGEARDRLTAFTVGGELTTHNETEIAARTAANLGVKHKLVHLTRNAQEEWTRLALLAMDQPSCDGVNTYVVSRASREAGLVVALGGSGADEFHGAYGYAASLSRLSRGFRATGFLAGPSARLAAWIVGLRYGDISKERLELMLAQAATPWRLAQEKRRFFTSTQIASFWPESSQIPHRWQSPLTDELALEALPAETQITLVEACGYLLNTLLRDSDWATMANQQELRVPYLGRRYIELMLAMPTEMLAPKGKVLKPLLAEMISPTNRALVNQPKKGFAINYAELLCGPFRDDFHASCAWLNERLGFRLDASKKLMELQAAPSGKTANRLWAFLALGRYLERFVR